MNTFDPDFAAELADKIRQLYAGALLPTLSVAETDTQVFIEGSDDGRVHVIFPGTASVHDWITDLRFVRLGWPQGGCVHAGFRDALYSVLKGLHTALPIDHEIIFAGHSLGGALAMLAAQWAHDNDYIVSDVYTFGQPRVGNAAFARAYNRALRDSTWRIVNHQDPVPRVPWFMGTYRHAGTQVYLDAKNAIRIHARARREKEDLLAAVQGSALFRSNPLNLFEKIGEHHHITEYISKLRDREVKP